MDKKDLTLDPKVVANVEKIIKKHLPNAKYRIRKEIEIVRGTKDVVNSIEIYSLSNEENKKLRQLIQELDDYFAQHQLLDWFSFPHWFDYHELEISGVVWSEDDEEIEYKLIK